MATNPMQRKSRNSFLGGMLIMLVIALIIGAIAYVFITNKNKESKSKTGAQIVACVLNQDIKSGDEITSDMLVEIETYQSFIPSNYINADVINNIINEGKQVIAKVDMTANTVLTDKLVARKENAITSDVRLVEYNMLTLPTKTSVGDYIDVRLMLPNGQDLIVVSKKQIKTIQGDTIGIYLSEGEIVMMSSAIVEAYIVTASNLYAIQYVEAGMQNAATQTYTPTAEVQALIAGDPNIVEDAKTALQAKFSSVRGYIDGTRANYIDEQDENLETEIKEQIERAKKAREEYLTGLQEATV